MNFSNSFRISSSTAFNSSERIFSSAENPDKSTFWLLLTSVILGFNSCTEPVTTLAKHQQQKLFLFSFVLLFEFHVYSDQQIDFSVVCLLAHVTSFAVITFSFNFSVVLFVKYREKQSVTRSTTYSCTILVAQTTLA